MTLADVTEAAVRVAVAEFDAVGRDQFLEDTGFGRAKSYFLDVDGSSTTPRPSSGTRTESAATDRGEQPTSAAARRRGGPTA